MRVVRELPAEAWRDFLSGNTGASVFHTPEVFAAFAAARGHRPSLWATVDGGGEVLALLLPVETTVVGGPFRALTTRAVVHGGILIKPDEEGAAGLARLLESYRASGNALFTEIRNTRDVSALDPVLRAGGFAREGHLNFLIDLARSRDEVWNGIRPAARRNIRKAEKAGVTIEDAEDVSDLEDACTVLEAVYRRLAVPLPDRSLFRAMFGLLRPRGMMRVLLARHAGATIGALTLLSYAGTLLYWYTGTLREHSALRAGDLLVWRALELGIEEGCHTFDFGGGGRPDEPYGVRDFKAKFGGELVDLGRHTRVHAPVRLFVSRNGYRVMRRLTA